MKSSKAFSIILGILAVLIGVSYALQALDIDYHFTIFIKGWWTIFIIVPGLVMLFTRGSNKVFSIFLTGRGIALFLRRQDQLPEYVRALAFPALFIIVGISLIFSAIFGGRLKKNSTATWTAIPGDGSIPAYEVSFGELAPDYNNRNFEGCSMDITFGSGTLDLRNSIIDKEVTITINTAFSGVKIQLPPGCNVDLQTSTSFGGVNNKYISSEMPDAPIVHIIAAASFAGVEIK